MAEKQIVDAIKKAIEGSSARERKFKQTLDLAINLKNVDMKNPKNRLDEEIQLPHGRGRDCKIAVFAGGETAVKAKERAELVISPEQLNELAGDKKKIKKIAEEYTFFIAEAPMMATIGKSLGKVLAPRGKMPKPIPPHGDATSIIEAMRNTIRLRSKDKKTFHTIVGAEDMDPEKVAENIEVLIKRVESRLERGRMNIGSVYIKTTMGPAVRIF
ncbi:MAG: 50S ribosomal protein L1 [Thermoplasmata archaeon HGW-Thermoplasmata-1]|nr:MAG: 50S ribosomal protein L1 [Thermoplasmata archaeon HGW-Thermoplasmata-1]